MSEYDVSQHIGKISLPFGDRRYCSVCISAAVTGDREVTLTFVTFPDQATAERYRRIFMKMKKLEDDKASGVYRKIIEIPANRNDEDLPPYPPYA